MYNVKVNFYVDINECFLTKNTYLVWFTSACVFYSLAPNFGTFFCASPGIILIVSGCLSDDNFRKPSLRKLTFTHPVFLHGQAWRSSGQGQGYGSKKVENVYCPQSIISISHNYDSINVKPWCLRAWRRIWFSYMADPVVWPPSLSRDRKWPRITKCTHSRVVGLR